MRLPASREPGKGRPPGGPSGLEPRLSSGAGDAPGAPSEKGANGSPAPVLSNLLSQMRELLHRVAEPGLCSQQRGGLACTLRGAGDGKHSASPSAPCRKSRRAGRGVPRPRGRVQAAFLLLAVPPCGLPLGAGREVRTLSRRHALPHPGEPEHGLDRGRGRGVPGSRSRRVDELPSPFPTRPAGTRGAGAARRVFTDSRAEISPRICGGSLVTAAKPPPALHFRTLLFNTLTRNSA